MQGEGGEGGGGRNPHSGHGGAYILNVWSLQVTLQLMHGFIPDDD